MIDHDELTTYTLIRGFWITSRRSGRRLFKVLNLDRWKFGHARFNHINEYIFENNMEKSLAQPGFDPETAGILDRGSII